MRCKACHYSLKNLTDRGGHRCPECGRAFDPADSRTFGRTRYHWFLVDSWMFWAFLPLIIILGFFAVGLVLIIVDR